MAIIDVVEKIPTNYTKTLLRKEMNGNSYLTADGDVYKQFNKGVEIDSSKLRQLNEVTSPYFAFPRQLVAVFEKDHAYLDGYRRSLVQGKKHIDLDPKATKMETIIKASRLLETEIIRIAKEYGIVLFGVDKDNVLLRRNGTYGLFETDLYEIIFSEDQYDTIKESMKEWNRYLLFVLQSGIDVFNSERINNFSNIAINNGKYRASNVIEEIINEIRKQTGIDPVTLEEYQEGVKLIRKK